MVAVVEAMSAAHASSHNADFRIQCQLKSEALFLLRILLSPLFHGNVEFLMIFIEIHEQIGG